MVAVSARAEPSGTAAGGQMGLAGHMPPDSADSLDAARWSDRVGDAAVLTYLSSKSSAGHAWVAILAAPHLRAPELSLLALAKLAGGRDPDLAPSAARAALSVVSELSFDDLGRREVVPSDLEPALEAFCALREQARVRLDITLMAGQVAMQLVELGIGACPGTGPETADPP